MTVTSCSVYKVIMDIVSIYHLCINSIHRIGLINNDLSIHLSSSEEHIVHVSILLSNSKQSITSLSLLVGTTVRTYQKDWVLNLTLDGNHDCKCTRFLICLFISGYGASYPALLSQTLMVYRYYIPNLLLSIQPYIGGLDYVPGGQTYFFLSAS